MIEKLVNDWVTLLRGFNEEPIKKVELGVELPVTYKPREFTDGKKIHWRDGFEAIYTLIKYRFID